MALPPNWARYTTDDGKEYFHNAATNVTQWDKPQWAAPLPESLSFHSGTSDVYQYRPTDLDLGGRGGDQEDGRTVAMGGAPAEAAGKAMGGKLPSSEPAGASPNSGLRSSSMSSSWGGGLMGGVIAAASGEDNGDQVSGLAGSALTYAQQFFEISSDDVVKRVKLSMTPYPQPSADVFTDFRERPDFWGPFWISTTAVLFFSATGNFAKLLETENRNDFKADYGLVSLAAAMVYGFLIGVPLLIRVALYFAGHEVDSVNFKQMICVYGYSLTPAIPASILCLLPMATFRWLSVLLGLAASLAFIRGSLWSDLAIEAPSLKWKMIALFTTAQGCIFFIYRIHFFS